MPDDDNLPTAAAVTLRAPPFSPLNPSMWFAVLECGFKASKITNKLTQFTHAASFLPLDVLPQVSDVISKASTSTTPYEDLKTAILSKLQPSIATRLKELCSKDELGDESLQTYCIA
ncbi:hypothetical protein GWK47_011068 [Chionoecetes opilio]|uniref:DUF7041 domain-containing protein n=1 Tax=Chionoecetes opilio TaxID=41210 RepID=A0A8J5CQ15_CHIOP|nr:hypothetical protein GWK47_011068 [Chionoecetes opilio]